MKSIYYYLLLLLPILSWLGCDDPVTITEYGRIEGQVTDLVNAEVMEGVTVSTNPSTSITLTDADGYFALDSLPLGKYTVRFRKDGYRNESVSMDITDGRTYDLLAQMDRENLENAPPSVPDPVSPVPGDLMPQPTVLLQWKATDEDAEDTLRYDVAVYENGGSEPIKTWEKILTDSVVARDLRYGQNYTWQVIVSDGVNQPVYGPTWSFSIRKQPTTPVLFVRRSETTQKLQIYGVNDNGDLVRLTEEEESSWRPHRSPNGERIAFVRYVSALSAAHLFTMRPDGSDIRRASPINFPIFGYDLNSVDYAWSPGSDKLLYPGPGGKLYLTNTDQSGITEVAQPPANRIFEAVAWSRENDRVVVRTVSQDQQVNELYALNRNTGALSLIAQGSGVKGNPVLSYSGVNLLYTVDLDPQPNAIGRQWNAHVYLLTWPIGAPLAQATLRDLSINKPQGINDIEPDFTPTEAEIIVTQVDNDVLINPEKPYQLILVDFSDTQGDPIRTLFVPDGRMPDWN